MRRGRIRCAAIAAALAVGACGGDEAPAPPSSTAAGPTTTTLASQVITIGTEVRTARGNTVTVHGIEPVAARAGFPTPAVGRAYVAADVGGCQARPGPGGEGPDPSAFELVMPDNTRARSTIPIREPSLSATRLAAGDCVRGWITFDAPAGVRPVAVVFNASTLVRWTVP